jgi:MinD-like ATPase involved in chromosome partitioning or flagellar assembly
MSTAHLISAGHHIDSPNRLLNAPRLAVTIEALAQSYDYVIIDAGAVPEVAAEQFARFAQIGVLVVKDPRGAQAATAERRLQTAGFDDLTMLVANRS